MSTRRAHKRRRKEEDEEAPAAPAAANGTEPDAAAAAAPAPTSQQGEDPPPCEFPRCTQRSWMWSKGKHRFCSVHTKKSIEGLYGGFDHIKGIARALRDVRETEPHLDKALKQIHGKSDWRDEVRGLLVGTASPSRTSEHFLAVHFELTRALSMLQKLRQHKDLLLFRIEKCKESDSFDLRGRHATVLSASCDRDYLVDFLQRNRANKQKGPKGNVLVEYHIQSGVPVLPTLMPGMDMTAEEKEVLLPPITLSTYELVEEKEERRHDLGKGASVRVFKVSVKPIRRLCDVQDDNEQK